VAVLVDGPAARAGVKDGDHVEKVDGVPVSTKQELFDALDAAAAAAKGSVVIDVRRTVPADAKAPEGTKATEQQLSFTLATPDTLVLGQTPRLERFGVTAEELAPGPIGDVVAKTGVVLREQQDAAQRRFGLFSVDGRVAHVEAETVAAERGLQKEKHIVIAVDGKPLRTPQDLSAALETTPDAVHAIGVVGPDGARVIAFRMLPHPRRELGGMKVFGVALTSAWGDGATVERSVGPVEALQRAVTGTGDLVMDVLRGFGLLFSGKVGIESLGGPITIAKMSGQAAQVGADVFIQLMGLISVNLAIINLLPVPVLDGGHLMIFTIEAITRRRMSLETRMKITKVGIALVGLLMVVAIGNDVLGLF
jgi:RIP metalloprotease RseP